MKRVRKAVIPVAGFGTRFLPITKGIPKEMLPMVDVPTIQLIVEECVASGVDQIVFVNARTKHAIEDYFDRHHELEWLLERKGRTRDLEMLLKISSQATFTSVRQGEARGLGHAVLCARDVIGDEPFAVVLGDDLVEAQVPGLRQLIDVFDRSGQGVVGLQEVPEGHEHLYGIVQGVRVAPRDYQVTALVEKPPRGTAPSRLAIIGRYVLPPEIFPILAATPAGRGDEIQLTDALATLCARQGLHGVEIDGLRFDAGDRAGYVLAQLHYALKRPDIAEEVRAGARRLLASSEKAG